MTIDPNKVTPEIYLLAKAEAADVRLQHLEAQGARIEEALREMKEAHSSLGWRVSGALASAIGALLAAGIGLLKGK